MAAVAGRVQRSMAILETARGKGSGFILDMGGTKYLVTNDHVLRGGAPFRAMLIDGTKLVTWRVEAENTRDLVRLPLLQADNLPALKLAAREPTIGEPICVFGNSDGASVVTGIAGKILGIGPDAVEIDAEFVRGNSGSPIVLADGSVVGVATFVTVNPDPRDWVRRGTRFSAVRRFGERFRNVKWVAMKNNDYFVRVDYLADLETFCHDVHALYYTAAYFDRQKGAHVYSRADQGRRYRRCGSFPRSLEDLVTEFNKAVKRSSFSAMNNARSKMAFTSPNVRRDKAASEYERVVNAVRSDLNSTVATKSRRTLNQVSRLVKKNDWRTRRMKDEAEGWLTLYKMLAFPE